MIESPEKETYRPNVELYKRLAVPCDKEAAQGRIKAFREALEKLREEHEIPEMIVTVGVHYRDGEKHMTAGSVAMFGAYEDHLPELIRLTLKRYHEIMEDIHRMVSEAHMQKAIELSDKDE